MAQRLFDRLAVEALIRSAMQDDRILALIVDLDDRMTTGTVNRMRPMCRTFAPARARATD